MINKLVLFILSFFVWIFLRYPPDWQHISIGLAVSFIVAVLCGNLFTAKPKLFLQPVRYFWFMYFVIVSAYECFTASIAIALRLVKKNIPLNPGIIELKTSLRTETGLMLLANTITLTKAITVDVDKQNNLICIHCIDLKQTTKTEMQKYIEGKEKILAKIFE